MQRLEELRLAEELKEKEKNREERLLAIPDNIHELMSRKRSVRRATTRHGTMKRATFAKQVVEVVDEQPAADDDDEDDPFTARFGQMAFNVKNATVEALDEPEPRATFSNPLMK